MKRRILFFSLPILFLVCFFIFGQTAKAAIMIYFTDVSGQVSSGGTGVANATVNLFYPDGGSSVYSAQTDQNGYYSLQVHTFGNSYYNFKIFADGYKEKTEAGVLVPFNSQLNLNFELEPLVEELDPVILVPGIMGSYLYLNQWQIDPILHTYDDLIEAMLQNGYELNKNLFLFPYNWRQNNIITAGQLKEKINAVKLATGKQKVDLVAHSMGGIVSRAYIQSSDYQNDIDQVIFLAVPHKGSPEDYLVWEGSLFLNYNWLMDRIIQLEAAEHYYLNILDYIREQAPSVEQLLPIYNYLQNKDNNNNWLDRLYPIQYPRNYFLENLNLPVGLNALKQRVMVTNIFSSQATDATVVKIKVVADPYIYDNKWPDGYPENLDNGGVDSFILGVGDGTVPEESANSLEGVETIEFSGFDHRGIVSGAQTEVIETLTGKHPENYISGKWAEIKRIFFIRVYSPVDFTIIAPDGKRVGKDFLNNTQFNEIDGAFYSGFDSATEFITIPDPLDGEYKIELEGTGQGEYKLSASLIDSNNQVDQEFSGTIITGEQRDFNITYSAQAENPLSDLAPIDTIPPVIAINQPVESEKYLHSDDLIIDYKASDDFSGIATTAIMIDDQVVATATIDLFDYALGQHNLSIIAIDKAGNRVEAQVNFLIITDIDSTISDIEKINELGWLKSKLYRPLLINALRLIKIEARYFDKQQDLTEKLIKKIQDNHKLTDKQKQKLIDQYNKKFADLEKNRTKAIDKSLEVIEKLLSRAKKKNQINQAGYDIIINDINYLRINL